MLAAIRDIRLRLAMEQGGGERGIMKGQHLELRAAIAIAGSSLHQFESAIEWGHWCRCVANAALAGDAAKLARLTPPPERHCRERQEND